MGSVFAGRMILVVSLYSLKKCGIGADVAPQLANGLPA